MGRIPDRDAAKKLLEEEAQKEPTDPGPNEWIDRFQKLSEMCEKNNARTHIAFLGIAILAKSVDSKVNVFSVKSSDKGSGAYSARSFGHATMVALAPRLKLHLGATGREPLNNQPYFRIKRLTKSAIVVPRAEAIVDNLISILEEVSRCTDQDVLRGILRAYVHVRRKYFPKYATPPHISLPTPKEFCKRVENYLESGSEGGRKAQAICAGLLDVFYGSERVIIGDINDPDRNMPGDVGIVSLEESNDFDRVFEVRDKPVTVDDLYHFAKKAADNDIRKATVVAVHKDQAALDWEGAYDDAKANGVDLAFVTSWAEIVQLLAFWVDAPENEAMEQAFSNSRERLIETKATEAVVEEWDNLFPKTKDQPKVDDTH